MEGSSVPALAEGSTLFDTVSANAGDFLDLVGNVGSTCMNNEICLAFLSITFISLAVRMLRRVIGAFGRGR